MKKNSLKAKLLRKELVLGSWVSLAHPSIPEIMAGAGFDFLTIDMEHSTIELGDAENLIRAIHARGLAALVRVGENDANLIKRVMDTGADGIIVAMINTAQEARHAVAAVKYPPQGSRGVGFARAQGFGMDLEGYKKWLEKESIVMALIEQVRGLDNLQSILEVEGLDGTLIGPNDLSASLGYPGEFQRPEVKKAVSRYERICKKIGKPMGFHMVYPEAQKTREYIQKGYRFLGVGLDTLYLGAKCKEVMSELRKKI